MPKPSKPEHYYRPMEPFIVGPCMIYYAEKNTQSVVYNFVDGTLNVSEATYVPAGTRIKYLPDKTGELGDYYIVNQTFDMRNNFTHTEMSVASPPSLAPWMKVGYVDNCNIRASEDYLECVLMRTVAIYWPPWIYTVENLLKPKFKLWDWAAPTAPKVSFTVELPPNPPKPSRYWNIIEIGVG